MGRVTAGPQHLEGADLPAMPVPYVIAFKDLLEW